MHVRQLTTHVEVLAPAKVNLLLEVLARRPDGYHEIETVMIAVTIYDTLLLKPSTRPEITLRCRWAHGLAALELASAGAKLSLGDLPEGPDNLAYRAVELLRQRAGLSRRGGNRADQAGSRSGRLRWRFQRCGCGPGSGQLRLAARLVAKSTRGRCGRTGKRRAVFFDGRSGSLSRPWRATRAAPRSALAPGGRAPARGTEHSSRLCPLPANGQTARGCAARGQSGAGRSRSDSAGNEK
jgi:hypothetical protein